MNTILAIINSLILDLTYTTDQLKRFISIASVMVQRDVDFIDKYTIDILNNTLTPDPTDNNFCLFVATQASILIVKAELKTSATNSLKVTDGPSTIDLSSQQKSLSEYLKNLQDDYEKAKLEYLLSGDTTYGGYAVLTPTTWVQNGN